MAVMKKYFDLKKEDAASPPPRQNAPYVSTLPAAPGLNDVRSPGRSGSEVTMQLRH